MKLDVLNADDGMENKRFPAEAVHKAIFATGFIYTHSKTSYK
jgi:hypothetical protein